MDPQAVLATVRALGTPLPRTLVVGCQPASMAEGIGLTPAVAEAVEVAVAAVADVVRSELAGDGG